MLLAGFEVWFEPGIAPHSFVTFLPPLAYFISHYLLLIRRKRIAEIMLWLFLAGMLTSNYASRRDLIAGIDFSDLFAQTSAYDGIVRGKRIMVVGNDPGLYRFNSLGGGFLDWELSREYFEHPEYFENMIRLNNAFVEDPPEVVFDTRNLMQGVFERLPAVERRYRKKGATYWLINN
jgi:hypothetical protein